MPVLSKKDIRPVQVLTEQMIERDAQAWQEEMEKSVQGILTAQKTAYRRSGSPRPA